MRVGKTIVAFSEAGESQVAVRLDAASTPVRDVTRYDLFGNAQPVQVLPGNIALLPVTADPCYLVWNSTGDPAAVSLVPPLLALRSQGSLLEGGDEPATLVIHNPSAQPMHADVTLSAASMVPIAVQPTTQPIDVPADGQVELPLTFHVGMSKQIVDLPLWWRVFPDADPSQLVGKAWEALPTELKKADGSASVGVQMYAIDNRLEFIKAFGSPKEHRPAVGLAYINCDQDCTLSASANADWWMDWYVNGQLVFDSERDGKGAHGSMLDHPFDLPLKSGRNVIAFNCGAGSQGWSIQFGGPRVRQMMTPNSPPADCLRAVVTVDGHELATLAAPLRVVAPIDLLGAMKDPTAADEWLALEPFAVLGSDRVQNLFYKEPDASRWYKGESDLSAVVWLRDDAAGDKVQLCIAVRDDKHVPAAAGEPLDAHDSLHCILTNEAGQVITDALLAATPTAASPSDAKIVTSATRDESGAGGPTTWYHVAVPRQQVAGSAFHINLRIADDDGFGLKQTIDLGNITSPASGPRSRLR